MSRLCDPVSNLMKSVLLILVTGFGIEFSNQDVWASVEEEENKSASTLTILNHQDLEAQQDETQPLKSSFSDEAGNAPSGKLKTAEKIILGTAGLLPSNIESGIFFVYGAGRMV